MTSAQTTETATLGGGCFWCLDSALQQLQGLNSVICGYSGGHTVHLYGSGGPAGIDAIQLELGRALRTDARFGVALGDAITVFCRAYLAGEVAAVGASRAD